MSSIEMWLLTFDLASIRARIHKWLHCLSSGYFVWLFHYLVRFLRGCFLILRMSSVVAIHAAALTSAVIFPISLLGIRSAPSISPLLPSSHLPDSLLDRIGQSWFRLPTLVRFFVSGNLGNGCFFLMERWIHNHLCQIPRLHPFVEEYKDSISFFIGYILQIITQHLLHAILVYGVATINTRKKYWKTLLGQSWAYLFAMFGSTFLNLLHIL